MFMARWRCAFRAYASTSKTIPLLIRNGSHLHWSAIVELYWDNRDAMEAAWASPEGQRATEDLDAFVDLTLTSWSVVDEVQP